MKILEFLCENHEYHENQGNHLRITKKNKNHKIPQEKLENNENHIILSYNLENQ